MPCPREQDWKHDRGARYNAELLQARSPAQLQYMPSLPLMPTQESKTEEIRETLAVELVATGFGSDGDPTDRERRIEATIDWLGRRSGRPLPGRDNA